MLESSSPAAPSREISCRAWSGAAMLLFNLALIGGGVASLVMGIRMIAMHEAFSWLLPAGPLLIAAGVISLFGHFTLQPNEARVLILFGRYCGTARTSGFYWANPFYARIRGRVPIPGAAPVADKSSFAGVTIPQRTLSAKISLRARNFISEKLKVNDKRGNPIAIAAVIVWRVTDTARAAFDVDDFESYVQIQSEAAIRHMASLYSYDQSEEAELTLRGSADEVAAALQGELQTRLEKAGVTVDEARLTHLAYAPEIAQAMLRRQQAEAVIAARQKIVQGAVSMVAMALHELSENAIVQLDEERKASMVSNLLVVLCGESEVHPVINTGTLYS